MNQKRGGGNERFLEAFSIRNRDRFCGVWRIRSSDRHSDSVTHVEKAHKIG